MERSIDGRRERQCGERGESGYQDRGRHGECLTFVLDGRKGDEDVDKRD